METIVFLIAGAIVLGGAVGVVALSNTVHAALSLVATLFGVAVLFVAQEAHFLAAVQVIVYAGAIVVLFLFVIMLLGVDRTEDVRFEPLAGQRPAAVVGGLLVLGLSLIALLAGGKGVATGAISTTASRDPNVADITDLGILLFTKYVFAFEATAILLTVSVVAAVVLARRLPADGEFLDESGSDEGETGALTVDEPGEAVR